MKNLKPSKTAAREAYEEAGVRGEIASRSVGSFVYEKLLDDEIGAVPCEVRVFPLLVKRQLKTWPEKREREIRWLKPGEAIPLVGDEGLRALIESFAKKAKKTPT